MWVMVDMVVEMGDRMTLGGLGGSAEWVAGM